MPNETTIYAKLRAAQADMANPVKSKAVQAGAKRYNYEVLADVLEIVTNALHAHGLALVQGVVYYGKHDQDAPIPGWTLKTAVADDDRELILDVRPIDFPSDPQAAGSKETYARRYALKTAFGLAGVDDDGEAAKRAAAAPVSRSKAPSSTAPTANPSPATFAAMKALLDRCRNAGMDMATVGSIVATEIPNKKSTEYGPAEYAKACAVLEDLLKEANS